MRCYFEAMKKYFKPQGRASRKEFWHFRLVTSVFLFIALILDSSINDTSELIPSIFTLIILITHLLPTIMLTIRRLHDLDMSGWYALVELIPGLGSIWILAMGSTFGTNGENKYGEPIVVKEDYKESEFAKKFLKYSFSMYVANILLVFAYVYMNIELIKNFSNAYKFLSLGVGEAEAKILVVKNN